MHYLSLQLFAEDDSSSFVLTSELLEAAILEQQELGRKVRGFIFCNPNNPLGAVYSWDLTRSLMAVCARHQVHFIADEIYALSVYGKMEGRTDFKSVLSIPEDEVSRYLDKLIYLSIYRHSCL